MKEQNYDVLEDQIEPSPKSLGKVRKEVIGALGNWTRRKRADCLSCLP